MSATGEDVEWLVFASKNDVKKFRRKKGHLGTAGSWCELTWYVNVKHDLRHELPQATNQSFVFSSMLTSASKASLQLEP